MIGPARRARLPGATRIAESEAVFQDAVVQLARLCGWRVYHPYDSRRSRAGWPDLALWRPGRFLLRELKTTTGRLTPQQTATLEELAAAGLDVAVWRPDDWDAITADLQRR